MRRWVAVLRGWPDRLRRKLRYRKEGWTCGCAAGPAVSPALVMLLLADRGDAHDADLSSRAEARRVSFNNVQTEQRGPRMQSKLRWEAARATQADHRFPSRYAPACSWSPDGSKIAFTISTSRRDARGCGPASAAPRRGTTADGTHRDDRKRARDSPR